MCWLDLRSHQGQGGRRRPDAPSLIEREEISHELARGESLRQIASLFGRSVSTASREVSRNGGRRAYRAARAEERAWDNARRPQDCLLAKNPRLCELVAGKPAEDWSPEQISGSIPARSRPASARRSPGPLPGDGGRRRLPKQREPTRGGTLAQNRTVHTHRQRRYGGAGFPGRLHADLTRPDH
ncbi:helix-turn-helix domain-containing protein [Streptomyces sp. NPDC086023]|uniref:helix-turn-helix domain-containing protein n=1 Tax=Streptomyces sp. NPDC086023 TaxID=3365746 RepID=UPI0037D10226